MAAPPLILASTSRYRKELLARLGLEFTCLAPTCDEAAAKALGLAPQELAATLARTKAESVFARHPTAVVIGSDQVCVGAGQLLGKPGGRSEAIAQVQRLAGRTHELLTAVCVRHPGGRQEFLDIARLTMRSLTPAAIERAVDADQPFDCAGGYKLEARGIALFARIESADHTAIVGLPLLALTAILADLGYPVP